MALFAYSVADRGTKIRASKPKAKSAALNNLYLPMPPRDGRIIERERAYSVIDRIS
jgi:hypothetical protein